MVEARQLLEGAVDTHVHSSPDLVARKLDDFELVRQARERGMAGLLQKKLAERGVYFERTFNVTQPRYNTLDVAGLAARIRDVGPSSTIMATDFGQPDSPTPAEGLESYIQGMLTHGLSEDEVRQMVSVNARGLLEL